MEYDGMNEDEVYPNGKHQWCLWMQSMSMLKEQKMVKSRPMLPLRQMITYERCMKVDVMWNPFPCKEELGAWESKLSSKYERKLVFFFGA